MSAAKASTAQHKAIEELFGGAGDDDDLLANIGQAEEVEPAHHAYSTGHEQFGGNGASFFDEDVSGAGHEESDFANLIGASHPPPPQGPHAVSAHVAPIALDDKDFSDLLAEFEAEGGELSPEAGDLASPTAAPEDLKQELGGFAGGIEQFHHPSAPAPAPAPQDATGLFADDGPDDLFDSLGISTGPSHLTEHHGVMEETPDHSPPHAEPEESPVPTLSIEHESADVSMQSIFTDESDWLGDTTVEESFAIHRDDPPLSAISNRTDDDGDAPVAFDVPEGWYDDNGEFQYYTAEEREAVRQTMLGERKWDTGEPESPVAPYASGDRLAAPYSPALEAAHSENAARRTPVAEQQPFFSQNEYNAYAPPPALSSSTNLSPYAATTIASTSSYSSSAYTPATSSYAPQGYAPSAPAAAPAASTYDPYAPPPQPFVPPALNQSQTRSAIPPIAGPSTLAPPSAKPAAPQRMASNAYDPPLRPSKSFVRPVSSAPAAPFAPPPLPAAQSPPVGPPAGPPRGAPSGPPGPPPRKGSTGSAPHSRQASLGTPTLASELGLLAEEDTSPGYDQYSAPKPPSRPPSAARPPAPPSQNSFDPPLRPPSATRSVSRASAKPAFSPPPPPPQSLHPSLSHGSGPPSRPSSRGPVRKASPMFEAPPPSSSRRSSQIYANGAMPPPPPPPAEGRIVTPLPIPDLQVTKQEEHDWRDRSDSPPRHEEPDPIEDPEGGSWNGAESYMQAPPPPPPVVTDPYAPSAYQPAPSQSYEPPSSMPTSPMRAAPPFNPYAQASPPSAAPYNPYGAPSSAPAPPQPPPAAPAWAPPRPPIPSFVDPAGLQPSMTSPEAYPAFGTSPGEDYFQVSKDHTYTPQQVLEQRPISEDPLGRCTLATRNIPLAVFGFGGVLITAFPASAEDDLSAPTHNRTPSYGYASGRGQLWIRKLSDVIEPAVLKTHEAIFPGPLVLDATASKATAAEKKKKESVLAYITARAEEIERGLPYLKSSAKAARREEEGKLVVLKLLSAMITGDGHLSGTPAVEEAVRTALQNPSIAAIPSAASASTLSTSLSAPTRSTASTPQQLARLSEMMAHGDKQSAAEFAADHGLWSHALLIASCVNQDFWRDIAVRFTAAELGSTPKIAALKASYALFAGSTTDNVDALMNAANITQDPSADQWREVLSAIVFNGNATQLSCLVDLGNRFMAAGLVNAAQACYILSPTSPFGDITLAAYEKPIMLVQNVKDEDAIIFAEIAEYARSLITVPKGQELPIPGLPALLPYKLRRAWLAAEIGEVDRALKYCNAVEAATKIKNGPQLLSPQCLSSLEDLLERLTGTPSAAPSKGFGSRKSAKPGISSWIEGRLTKFIAGEDDSSAAAAKPAPAASKDKDGAVGPFSHFSTISPAPSTAGMSRNGSLMDMNGSGGYLGVSGTSARPSPFVRQASFGAPPPFPPPVDTHGGGGGYGDYMATRDAPPAESAEDETPDEGEEGEFINPMAALSLGPPPTAPPPADYAPKSYAAPSEEEDEDEDMGFGNKALSRNRTPKPEAPEKDADDEPAEASSAKESTTPTASPAKPEAAKSSGWLRGWWGKKEGDIPTGPIKAKLGDDSSMVYDKDLKRWIVKGQKPDALPAAPPPPPRAQTVSPSKASRPTPPAVSTPPPSTLSRSMGPGGSAPSSVSIPRSSSANPGLQSLSSLSMTTDSDTPAGRGKSSLAESITAKDVSGPPPGPPPPPGKPPLGPPIGLGAPPRPNSTTASLDDLLSRPPSKRPASVALRKGARNRYVDVFQPGQEGQGQS